MAMLTLVTLCYQNDAQHVNDMQHADLFVVP